MVMWRASAPSSLPAECELGSAYSARAGVGVATTLAVLVIAAHAWAVLAIATVLGVFIARSFRAKLSIAALGALLGAGVPWIVAPALTALLWLSLAPKDRPRRCRSRWSARAIPPTLLVGVGCGAVAAAVAFAQQSHDPVQLDMVAPPFWIQCAALILMAVANAFGEETIWRGLLADEMQGAATSLRWVAQIASFGFAHWSGLPGGPIGVLLAAGFSAAQYAIWKRHGMLASTVSHAIVDVIIFATVLPTVLFTAWFAPDVK